MKRWLLLGLGAAAGAYQGAALAAVVRRFRERDPVASRFPPVSVLKPVHGLDPHFYDAIRSHARQDYPVFEILFGVAEAGDPALEAIRRLQAEFPALPIRALIGARKAPNGKVGVLERLTAAARHPVLVVNDSDIRVPPDYLRRVVAPLEDPRNGVVTCLYRARGEGLPARLEALGIATDFAPSALVARLVGLSEFGFGSTLAFRAADLARCGGFRGIADYLADDYQLSRRIAGLGLKVVISGCVVETSLGGRSWQEVWDHQVRWARTIRVSQGGGYLGLPIANGTLWALALAASGQWRAAIPLMALRLASAAASGALLEDRQALGSLPLVPLRDLFGLAVWAAGLFGDTVVWREQKLRLGRDGKIVRVE